MVSCESVSYPIRSKGLNHLTHIPDITVMNYSETLNTEHCFGPG